MEEENLEEVLEEKQLQELEREERHEEEWAVAEVGIEPMCLCRPLVVCARA